MRIDEEFKALIPPLSSDERQILKASIQAEGIREPLVLTDDDVIIDGHNRYDIAQEIGIDDIPTETKSFSDRNAIMLWMIDNQRGRRNLTKQAWLDLGFKRAELLKPRAEANKGTRTDLSQISDTGSDFQPVDTLQEAADYAGVSRDTAAKYKRVMSDAPDDIRESMRSGTMSINKSYEETKRPHVSNNSGENEWYTPEQYIESARAVMGGIDLDPASSETANRTVQAGKYFTKEDDGLIQKWYGRVWMNPPYAQPLMSSFANSVAEKFDGGEIDEAIVLVNNATETGWFHVMLSAASAICLPKGRIKFIDMNGNPSGAPLQGQAILYFGPDKDDFKNEFSKYGAVLWK